MANKNTAPNSLYGNSRDQLREQERKNELLARIAGESYEAPGEIPKGKYVLEKRLLDAAQKENELLESIAEGGEGGGGANALGIDYSTDALTLKKNGEAIPGSGVTLPAYGLNYDTSTGGLTLTKNGTAVSGQTVSLPDYGSPLTASSTAGMTDTDRVYVNTADGKWYYYDGSAWTAGGTYNSQGIDTDKTLLVEGAAADAKVTGDKFESLESRTGDLESKIYDMTSIDPSTGGYTGFITASNTWSVVATRKCGMNPIPDGASKVTIAANSNSACYTAFLTTNSHNQGEQADYATGTGRDRIASGESKTYSIPEGAVYFYYSKEYDGTVQTPESISYFSATKISKIESDVATNAENIDKIQELLSIETTFEPTLSTYIAWITASNVWSVNSTRASGIARLLEGQEKVRITAHSDYYTDVAFLTSNAHASNTTPDYASGWSKKETLQPGTSKTYDIPSDAVYLYYSRNYEGVPHTPESITYIKLFDANTVSDLTNIPLGLHEMPRNETALNIVKRCRQMTDIEWTPAVDLNRLILQQRELPMPEGAQGQYFRGTFKAGVKYKGIPYGRSTINMVPFGYTYATPGNYIGFDTFVTSVSNPKSRLSKVNAGAVADHRSVIYATVCSGMTCYALNVPEVPTASIGSISGLIAIGKLNNDGVLLADSSILIGDILNLYDHHTAIITDIIRDEDGVIQFVELSDGTSTGLSDRTYGDGPVGGVCRRKGWQRADFFKAGSWGDYTVYRYNGEVPYTPSPYVNVGDEFDMQRNEHYPIMPYEGNGFGYKVGNIPDNYIKLVIHPTGYAYAKVFKDGVEISGSPFAVNVNAETGEIDDIEVNVIDAGSYTAYLCNITDGDVVNLTYPCSWTIE